MADGRRWSVSLTRRFVAAGIGTVAVFVMCFGAGMGIWAVGVLGFALLVLAISLVVVAAVRGGARSFVRGTAHVLDVTEPPANTPIGRGELQIVIEAPGLTPGKVKIRDTRVPVAKWPDIGDTLPIRVAIEDPRHVRILWDEVRTHGEEAAEEERFNEYVQRIVDAELSGDSGEDALDEFPVLPPEDETPPAAPPRRPSPRPRRSAEASGGRYGLERQSLPGFVTSGPVERAERASDAAGGSAVITQAAEVTETPRDKPAERSEIELLVAAVPMADLDAPAEDDLLIHDDEIPIYDIVPIEGASAVLGVPPEERGSPAAADADAVADLLAAYPSARPGGAGAIQGVGVTLIVTDLSRSVAFYRDMLGFYVVDSGSSSAVLASGETRIMLRAVADMPKVDRRLVHLNLEVDNVEAVYAELLGKGVKFIHRPRPVARGEHMELWAAAFRDPDGHGIAIIRWQPTD